MATFEENGGLKENGEPFWNGKALGKAAIASHFRTTIYWANRSRRIQATKQKSAQTRYELSSIISESSFAKRCSHSFKMVWAVSEQWGNFLGIIIADLMPRHDDGFSCPSVLVERTTQKQQVQITRFFKKPRFWSNISPKKFPIWRKLQHWVGASILELRNLNVGTLMNWNLLLDFYITWWSQPA